MCRSFNSLGFLTTFQMDRQFALNLRTKRDNPTEFQGEAYYEEQALSEMNPHASKMAIRDSSSLRLQLAFVFGDEDAMAQMLERIKDYPFTDANPPRLHSRLCFTGLAAFALSQKDGCKPYQKLGYDVSSCDLMSILPFCLVLTHNSLLSSVWHILKSYQSSDLLMLSRFIYSCLQ